MTYVEHYFICLLFLYFFIIFFYFFYLFFIFLFIFFNFFYFICFYWLLVNLLMNLNSIKIHKKLWEIRGKHLAKFDRFKSCTSVPWRLQRLTLAGSGRHCALGASAEGGGGGAVVRGPEAQVGPPVPRRSGGGVGGRPAA